MVLLSLDPVLDDQAPARFLRPPAVALQADHELLKFGSRKHFGLSSHGHGFRTPLWGALDGLETLGIEKVWETALLMLTELMLNYSDLDYGPVAEQIASHR
jgi:hypothetical protein